MTVFVCQHEFGGVPVELLNKIDPRKMVLRCNRAAQLARFLEENGHCRVEVRLVFDQLSIVPKEEAREGGAEIEQVIIVSGCMETCSGIVVRIVATITQDTCGHAGWANAVSNFAMQGQADAMQLVRMNDGNGVDHFK